MLFDVFSGTLQRGDKIMAKVIPQTVGHIHSYSGTKSESHMIPVDANGEGS